MTKGQRFNKKAAELMPHHGALIVSDKIDSYDFIDEDIFRNLGEYLGGMAAVIIAILKQEDK